MTSRGFLRAARSVAMRYLGMRRSCVDDALTTFVFVIDVLARRAPTTKSETLRRRARPSDEGRDRLTIGVYEESAFPVALGQ